MTAVIYARYSSDNQREESIEGQIRECTAYAEKNDITIVKHYIDRAISAKTDNRPQFQQMIKDSDKKLFDIVLVWKLDRFARNRYDSARYKTQLKKNGVKLMSATEIISEGPEGIILESVLEGYAEYYSADLAEKVVRGQTENILKGRCNGGRGTFGYTLDSERKFHIDPLASPFVLEAFRKYRDGLTMKEIRDWLNENGIKNPVGGAFTYNSVEHMLKNRRYIGELKFRDVVVPDAIPPIVPLELFDDVQEKIAKNKKAPARRKAEDDYLLTTKLHCGCCGALMFGESGTSRTGEVHRYYKCATAKKKKGCMPWKSALRKREFSEMRLDIFAAGVYSECYVVFADNTSLWWLKLLKPGFRHCYVILRLYKTGRWLELNPLSNQFLAAIYDYPPDFDFPGYIRTRRNVRLCRVEIAAAPPKCAPLSFFTCVEFVKRVIGLHDCFIHTPWQLYQKISKL